MLTWRRAPAFPLRGRTTVEGLNTSAYSARLTLTSPRTPALVDPCRIRRVITYSQMRKKKKFSYNSERSNPSYRCPYGKLVDFATDLSRFGIINEFDRLVDRIHPLTHSVDHRNLFRSHGASSGVEGNQNHHHCFPFLLRHLRRKN